MADEIFQLLKDNLEVDQSVIKGKISGMAGDGAFCKDNAPFKNKMRSIFHKDFKFRWDLLHLVNRAHGDALDDALKLKELVDYVQNHSSNLRSGLDYTNMYLDNIIGFKRPKLKSATRMVNYDFDQIERFSNNVKFFYHPHDKVEMSKLFLIISLSTKIILQICQKTTVSTNFVNEVSYEA